MSPLFRSKSMKMNGKAQEYDCGPLWGLTPSLILHALVIALLVYGSSRFPQQSPDEGAVNVVMVPPPEQMKPEPVPPPKDAKAEKPPEPKPEKPIEQKAEKPSPPPSSIEVLKPVFQFGAKDAGPKKSMDGNSAQESSASPARNDDPKQPDAVKGNEDRSAATPNLPKQEDAADNREATRDTVKDANSSKPDEQEAKATGTDAQEAVTGDAGEIELPMAAAAPRPRPAKVPKPAGAGAGKSSSKDVAVASLQGYSSLPGVRRLYSQGATGDPFATASMAGVPRDQRAGKLCTSALQQQLLGASYFAELVPLVPLKAGNVLDVPDTAFRTRAGWYRLGFRCVVDTDATRVLSFNFRVGVPIPRAEWAGLGLPARY